MLTVWTLEPFSASRANIPVSYQSSTAPTVTHLYSGTANSHHFMSIPLNYCPSLPPGCRTLPKHERLVDLHGSVIDHTYGGGSSIAVLLIMERLHRDLYTGLKVNSLLFTSEEMPSPVCFNIYSQAFLCLSQAGLSLRERLQIALDVVEGIRFLHSQGLLHRDIKLKNVLVSSNSLCLIEFFPSRCVRVADSEFWYCASQESVITYRLMVFVAFWQRLKCKTVKNC